MAERFLELVFRQKYLLILPMVLGIVTGVLLLSPSGKAYYVSRASVWVDRPTDLTGGSLADFNVYMTPAQNLAGTMQELLGTKTFASSVVNKFETPATDIDDAITELRENVSVSPFGTHVLFVEYRSRDPLVAQQAVTALVSAYSDLYTSQVRDRAGRVKVFYEDQLVGARDGLNRATTELRAYISRTPGLSGVNLDAPPSAALRDLTFSQLYSTEQAARASYNDLLDKYAESQISASALDGTSANFLVLDKPEIPPAPVQAGIRARLLPPVLGLAAGMMLGVIAFMVYWRLDRRVHLTSDLAFLGPGIPVMSLDNLKAGRHRWPPGFVRIAVALQSGLQPWNSRSLAREPGNERQASASDARPGVGAVTL